MQQLKIDPRFRDKIPPLRQEEKDRLEQDILDAGEAYEPIITWNGTIIDGHNRWEIIQRHPDIKYKIKEMDFQDEWAAIAWMCRKQCSRRNINALTFAKLIQEEYEATCKSVGGTGKNQYSPKEQLDPSGQIAKAGHNATRKIIANGHGISPRSVQNAVEFGRGLDAAEEVSPGIKQAVLSGEVKASKGAIAAIRNMPEDEKKAAVEAIRRGESPKKKSPFAKAEEPVGRSAEIRETYEHIQAAVNGLYDTDREVIYTIDDLTNELQQISDSFTGQIRRALTIRSGVLDGTRSREKALSVLDELEKKIRGIKELLK